MLETYETSVPKSVRSMVDHLRANVTTPDYRLDQLQDEGIHTAAVWPCTPAVKRVTLAVPVRVPMGSPSWVAERGNLTQRLPSPDLPASWFEIVEADAVADRARNTALRPRGRKTMQEVLSSANSAPPNSAPPSSVPACGAKRLEDRVWALHVFAFSSLVFAQPLFDLLARNAEFFVVRRSGSGEILALAAVLLVGLPVLLVLPVALARRRSPRLGTALLGIVLGGLAALFTLLTLTRASFLDGAWWLVAGLVAGLAVAWAYFRFTAVKLLATYLGLALAVVPASFFLHPRMLKIIFGQTAAELHTSGARTPIVFLLFDELSLTALLDESRRIDAVSYPNLAALAGEATWFANATTVSDATELAVPAILSGGLPHRDRLPILQDYPHNLFTIFGGDYKLWVNEPITQLCPAGLNTAAGGRRAPTSSLVSLLSDLWVVYRHLLLPPRFASHLPVISDRWQGFGDLAELAAEREATPPPSEKPRPEADDFSRAAWVALSRDRQDELSRFLDAFDADLDQALYFLHVLLPHTPWEYLPSGKAYAPQTDRIPGLEGERWQDDEALVKQAYQRYLLQVQYLDRWIGELVDRLRRLGLYDRSLIVLAADHGVSFRPGDSRRFLSASNLPDLIPVPLLVKAPWQRRGRVVERPMSTVDILPTILDLLDVDSPWPLEGRSAFDETAPDTPSRVVGKYRSFQIEDSLHEDKYATLDWKLATFDPGPAVLRAGLRPELYGRKLSEVGWREQDAVSLRLKGASLFRRDAAESAYSPSFISGVLEAAATDTECCELAVAVNGTLYATVRAFGAPPDNLQFTALVPDAAFEEGTNQVQVFRIREGAAGRQPELELLGSSGATSYTLVEEAGERVVALRQGARTIPVRPGALRGYFSTDRLSGKLRITGWAVDVEAVAAPREILVFHGGEMVYSGLTTKVRADVNAELGLTRPVRSAFQLDLPCTRLPDLGRSGLRLFAVSDSAASELGFFYTLKKDEEGRVETIQVTNAREIPIVPGSVAGVVEEVRNEDGHLLVQGWAADVVHRELPEKILVFVEDKAVYASHTFLAREDVAQSYAMPEILHSGFEYRVDLAPVEGFANDQLRVFAVSRRGEAVLLPAYLRLEGDDGCLSGLVFHLEEDSDGSIESIRVTGSGGVPVTDIPVVAGALEGYVDKVERTAEGRLRLGGWAVDPAHREPPEAVLVFAGGELVHASRVFVARGDVAERFAAPELLMSGFEHELDLPLDVSAADLLVVAVSKRGEAIVLSTL